jgi:hypothetical protein
MHLPPAPRGRGHTWWLVVPAMAMMACGDSSTGCDFCTSSAIVYGTVRRPDSSPVPGAPVTVTPFRNSCDSGDSPALPDVGVTTGSDGGYRQEVFAGTGDDFTACVRVAVREPGSEVGSTAVTADGVPVEFRVSDGRERDSIQVDVELPVAP